MKVIDNMAEAIRSGLRSFLRIEPAQPSVLQISEKLDFNMNAAKNMVWYRGDSDELSQLYKLIPCDSERFWKVVPTAGMEIEKNHTGIPGIIVDTITAIVLRDMNGIDLDEKHQSIWDDMEKEKKFSDILEDAISTSLVVGDGVFRVSFDPDISELPIIEFVPGDRAEIISKRGRVYEIVIKTMYQHDSKEYVLEETYGYGYIKTVLKRGGKEVELTAIPETEKLNPLLTYEGHFMMAEHFKIFKSSKYKGRGGSIFDKKTDSFDNLDEAWSQWMDALRKARTKEYIPENMLPRNPHTGEVLKPNAFDNSYISHDSPMTEGVAPKIEVVQPSIPVESYLSTYMTALDLCLQGIISPSTLGIDVKKLDNADAQREKEKATLYTRNKIIEAIQNTIPNVIRNTMKAYAVWLEQTPEDVNSEVSFGEYANPSFESQVETISKARTGQIMSIEASVEELYGDTKEDEWKQEEVKRLKAEQGIQDMEEPVMNLEGVNIDEGGSGQAGLPNEPKRVQGFAGNSQ